MYKLPISDYPEVVPLSFVAHALYPGANPKVIAETMAPPQLEEQINDVEDERPSDAEQSAIDAFGASFTCPRCDTRNRLTESSKTATFTCSGYVFRNPK